MPSETLFDSNAAPPEKSGLVPESSNQIAQVIQQLQDSGDTVEYTHAGRTSALLLREDKLFVVQSDGTALRNGVCPLLCRTLANKFAEIIDVSVRLANPGAAYGAFFSLASSKPVSVLLETPKLRRVALEGFIASNSAALENQARPIR